MAFCSNCGNRLDPEAKFCNKCGTRIITDNQRSNTERKLEYQGTVVKCPSCGAEVPAMAAICPDCGHEFNSLKVSNSLSKFIREINELDNRIAYEPKKGSEWSSWSFGKKVFWIIINVYTLCIPAIFKNIFKPFKRNKQPNLSITEQQKLNSINYFTLPSERSSIIELLRFIQGKIKIISESSVNDNDLYWANVWSAKASEIKDQADLVIPNDVLVASLSEKINNSMLSIKEKVKRKKETSIVLSILTIVAVTIVLVFVRTTDSKMGEFGNQIPKEKVTFSGWLNDNFVIGEQGCSFYKKDNGKMGVKIDIICVNSPKDEIQKIVSSNEVNPDNCRLTHGHVSINSYYVLIGYGYSVENDSSEMELFAKNLVSMKENTERIIEFELDPMFSDRKKLYNATSVVISCALDYEDNSNSDKIVRIN